MNKNNKTVHKEKKDMNKTYLFQYATINEIIEDTNLITRKQAMELVDKYLPDIVKKWNSDEKPQLCVWKNCKSNADYHTAELDIDFFDCVLEGGRFYRVRNFYRVRKELLL